MNRIANVARPAAATRARVDGTRTLALHVLHVRHHTSFSGGGQVAEIVGALGRRVDGAAPRQIQRTDRILFSRCFDEPAKALCDGRLGFAGGLGSRKLARMALDHFVSQVHLKNFYSPALGGRMYAVRKSDGKCFTPNAESVCRIEEGSTNAYLTHDRLIEELLTGIEPKYNAAAKKLAAGEIDPECIYPIAAFAAYIMTCSPAAMRIQSAPLKAMVESTARALDAADAFPPPPAALGSGRLTELLRSGKIKVTVDPKYPQVIGIAYILRMALTFANSAWDILKNPFDDCPFFTSDFPAAIEESADPRVLNRIVPLTPNLAVRIRPDISLKRDELDFTFEYFRYRLYEIEREELDAINSLLAQCAEDLVFYHDDFPWVKPFIMKYASFRIETHTQELGTHESALLVSRQRIVDHG